MPALKPCLVHRCTQYAMPGHAYCATHAHDHQRQNTADWKRERRQAIARAHGRCQLRLSPTCQLVANTVHHRDLNADNNSPANLAACCQPCHQLAHELERAAAARRIGAP